MTDSPPPATLAPGVRIGRYRVKRLLARGGLSEIYEATNAFGLSVVLKLLTPADDTASNRARFALEGRIQNGLRHPNIARITDMIDVDSRPALVIDRLTGPDLGKLVATDRLDTNAVVQIGLGILEGLSCAHAHGIVHRDVKPSNVMLDRSSTLLTPKLIDFGIAHLPGRIAAQQPQEFIGTPAYASPEQLRGDPDIDVRADVYGLGTTLYALLAGHRPYAHIPGAIDVMRAVFDTPLAPLPPRVPRELSVVIHVATARMRDARYPTAEAFASALARAAVTASDLSQPTR